MRNMEFTIGKIERKDTEPHIAVEVARERSQELVARAPDEITALADEETIRMLALAVSHPEWQTKLFAEIELEKAPLAPESRKKIMSFFENERGTSEHDLEIADEMKAWERDMPDVVQRFEALQRYFSPNEMAHRVIIVPSDTILPMDDGHSFHVGETAVIMGHVGNLNNADHEFLHGIINPIVRRLWNNLTTENRQNILKLAKQALVESYEMPESVLDEELIRIYNDHIKRGEYHLRSFSELLSVVNAMTEEQLATMLNKKSGDKIQLDNMGISSLHDLKGRIQEYYDIYQKDVLGERIAKLYLRFEAEKKSDMNLSFETFLNRNLLTLFNKD